MGEDYWRNRCYESRSTTRWLVNLSVGMGISLVLLVGALVYCLARYAV